MQSDGDMTGDVRQTRFAPSLPRGSFRGLHNSLNQIVRPPLYRLADCFSYRRISIVVLRADPTVQGLRPLKGDIRSRSDGNKHDGGLAVYERVFDSVFFFFIFFLSRMAAYIIRTRSTYAI